MSSSYRAFELAGPSQDDLCRMTVEAVMDPRVTSERLLLIVNQLAIDTLFSVADMVSRRSDQSPLVSSRFFAAVRLCVDKLGRMTSTNEYRVLVRESIKGRMARHIASILESATTIETMSRVCGKILLYAHMVICFVDTLDASRDRMSNIDSLATTVAKSIACALESLGMLDVWQTLVVYFVDSCRRNEESVWKSDLVMLAPIYRVFHVIDASRVEMRSPRTVAHLVSIGSTCETSPLSLAIASSAIRFACGLSSETSVDDVDLFVVRSTDLVCRERLILLSVLNNVQTESIVYSMVIELVVPSIDRIMSHKQTRTMVSSGKLESIRMLFQLVYSIPGADARIANLIYSTCKQDFDAAVLSRRADSLRMTDLVLVYTIVKIIQCAQTTVDVALDRNVVCAYYVNRMREECVNWMLDEKTSFSYMLAYSALKTRYLDTSLQRSHMDGVVNLLYSVRDKDIFLETLHVGLARFLLTRDEPVSLDLERDLLVMIKHMLGPYSVLKHEDMLKDYETSLLCLSSMCSGRVLKQSSWPSLFKRVKVAKEIYDPCDEFARLFVAIEENRMRKLETQWQAGRVTLGLSVSGRPYDMRDVCMSPIQASIVLMLAKQDETFESLASQMTLPVKYVIDMTLPLLQDRPGLRRLVAIKVDRSQGTAVKVKLTPTSVLCLNRSFVSSKKRVTYESIWVDPPVVAEKINESRDWEIRAAIVRVMKRDKSCTIEEIVRRTVEMVKTFVPAPRDIKRAIEYLIESDYIERSIDDSSTMNYVA